MGATSGIGSWAGEAMVEVEVEVSFGDSDGCPGVLWSPPGLAPAMITSAMPGTSATIARAAQEVAGSSADTVA